MRQGDLTKKGRVRREKSRGRHGCILRPEVRALTEESTCRCRRKPLSLPDTIDRETIPVQDVGIELGDTVGLLAQLPEEPHPVQPKVSSIRTVGAGDINSSGRSALFRPRERRNGYGDRTETFL